MIEVVTPEQFGSDIISAGSPGSGATTGPWLRSYESGNLAGTSGTYPAWGNWTNGPLLGPPYPTLIHQAIAHGSTLNASVHEVGYTRSAIVGNNTPNLLFSCGGGINTAFHSVQLPMLIPLPANASLWGRSSGASGTVAFRAVRADLGIPPGTLIGQPGGFTSIFPDSTITISVTPGADVYGSWAVFKAVLPWPFIPVSLSSDGSATGNVTYGWQVGYTSPGKTTATIVAEFPNDGNTTPAQTAQHPFLGPTIPAGAAVLVRGMSSNTTGRQITLNGWRADYQLWRT